MLLTVLGVSGPYPAAGSGTSGYLIQGGGKNLLLDCGCATVPELWKWIAPQQLDAVVLTHFHWDHVSDFMMLGTTYQFAKNRGELPSDFCLPVYMQNAPDEMAETIRFAPGADCFSFHTVQSGDCVRMGEMTLAFTPARHPMPCVGVRVCADGKCLYATGDTNVIPQLVDAARGADAIVADCGLRDEDWTENAPHLSASQCGLLARRVGAKTLYLGHLPPYVEESVLEAQVRQTFENAHVLHVAQRLAIE